MGLSYDGFFWKVQTKMMNTTKHGQVFYAGGCCVMISRVDTCGGTGRNFLFLPGLQDAHNKTFMRYRHLIRSIIDVLDI